MPVPDFQRLGRTSPLNSLGECFYPQFGPLAFVLEIKLL